MEQKRGTKPTTAQPTVAPPEEKAETQAAVSSRCIHSHGHGHVLLMNELCQEEEDSPGPAPDPQRGPLKSSSTRATCGSHSSRCSKRPSEHSDSPADSPPAKQPRAAGASQRSRKPQCTGGTWDERELADNPQTPRAPSTATSTSTLTSEPRPAPQLLLLLCRARLLRTQLPQLQRLLQPLGARGQSPPAALLGIVVQPRRDEEAEARRRMETLLWTVFAPHRPSIEVHTAVFCPNRPEGSLEVSRVPSLGHGVSAWGCGRFVDRQTQTDGEGPEGC